MIGKGFFLSPEFSYSRYTSSSENPPVSVAIDIRWFRGSMYLDVYPREFKLDTVAFTLRPFIRIGGGASCLLPRVRFNNELVNVDEETYKPILWAYQLSTGIGCRIALTNSIDISPVILYNFMPNVNFENFSYALHGTQVPNLSDKQRIHNIMTLLSLSFRLSNEER